MINYHHIHMIGIGGVSMSGIAEILFHKGYKVTGSDTSESEITMKLKKIGIPIVIGHDLQNSQLADAVVYTAAVKPDDPELINAKEHHVPTIERADFLGQITKMYENTICISGTHGKTTTTSMVSLCFLEANLDPTIQVGAILKEIDGNNKIGKSSYFIIEACEYVESFLKFFPKAEIILNIDNDHLDYFKTFDRIKEAFVKYVKLLPADGFLVVNGDDNNCLDLISHSKATAITYGIQNTQADFVAKNLVANENGYYHFDVYKKGKPYGSIQLSIPGKHNVLNALACISLCDAYGIDHAPIQKALAHFTGANRRFQYIGSYQTVRVFDDYAHHPTEIKSVANALKDMKYHESWAIFQPHTYSRTKNLLDDFARALSLFDHVIINDIYAARETNHYHVSAQTLVDKMHEFGKEEAIYMSDFEDIAQYLKKHVHPDDIILTIGAGTITHLGQHIVE